MKATLQEAVDYYFDRPAEFAEDLLGIRLFDYQATILSDLARYPAVAVRSGHGVGKTCVEAIALIWFLSTRPFSKVPCTAPTGHQLFDMLWAEVATWLRKSQLQKFLKWTATRVYVEGYKEDWFAVPRTSNKPENMQGFHAENLLFIIDEAAGIDDRIMAVVDGALTNEGAKVLMCANPTRRSGYFFNAFHKDRALWRTHHINSEESPLVSPEYPERMAQKWGKDSDIYRVRVLGEFPMAESDTFIPLELAEQAAIEREIDESGPLELGVDPARFGDDETVIIARKGMRVLFMQTHRKQDTTVTARQILFACRDLQRRFPDAEIAVKIDVDGLGAGVVDPLIHMVDEEKLKIRVCPLSFGGSGDDQYENATGVMWGNLRELLPEILIPDDEELIGQLSSRKYSVSRKGKIVLERKEEMKARGLPSPDRADALALAFAPLAKYEPPRFDFW